MSIKQVDIMDFKQQVPKFQAMLLEYSSFIIVPFIICIYFSTALSSILSVLVIVLWLCSGQFMVLPATLKKYPVAAWSMLLYVYFICASAYGTASKAEVIYTLTKYIEFFFIPLLVVFFTMEPQRNRAWKAIIAASVITLLGSYLMYFGLLGDIKQLDPSFKSRITHSILIAFFAFFCLHNIYAGKTYRLAYSLLFIGSAYNIFFIVSGRTGQLIFIALILLFALQKLDRKKLALTVVLLSIFLVGFACFSDKAGRLYEGIANTEAYFQPIPEQTDSSMGLRYTFWRNSLKLIAEKPWFGQGTGGFIGAYQRVAENTPPTKNPHNEFLRITVELGLVGLLVYSGFLFSQFYYAYRLPDNEKYLAQGVLITLLITSLFNSPFLDHTEGHWFAVLITLCCGPLKKADA
ncbi:MAG: O-antigen ligase family protein [Methylovulum sp.]|nr:O-antigen ligase family protein [Methylovulum sp.]